MRRHKEKGIHLLSCVGVIVNDFRSWEEVGVIFQHLKHVSQILLTIDLRTHHGSGECVTCAKYGVVNFFGHSFILLLMIYVKVHQHFLGQASLIMQTFRLE
jgi:hypothetical protein